MARRRLEPKDYVFWSVPLLIAAAGAFFAWQAYRTPPWQPPRDTPEVVFAEPCARGRFRCRERRVEMTTGDHAPDGSPVSCAWTEIAPCARECVSERVTLTGVDEATARTQLCDLPKQPLLLLSVQESFLNNPVADAGICEGDGYVPTENGFIQCIAKSRDPGAAGIVIARAICRAGAIRTIDRAPFLIKREEAAAVWCKRDPIADTEPDAGVVVDAPKEADAP